MLWVEGFSAEKGEHSTIRALEVSEEMMGKASWGHREGEEDNLWVVFSGRGLSRSAAVEARGNPQL